MRNLSLLFISFFFSLFANAQPPEGISYQAVVRSASGAIVPSQSVQIRFTIREVAAVGTIVYQEVHQSSTNQQGLVNLMIGQGTVVSGTFASINWSTANKFLQVEVDPSGGTNYVTLGTQQMMSVPYAFYSGRSGSSTFFAGSTNPLTSQGQNGDFYLNTSSYVLFGPKVSSGWGSGQSLIGPAGAQGLQGPLGLTGPQGLTGATGLVGPQGVAGVDGKTVLNGTTNPVNTLGSNGDFYINTVNNTLFGPKANGSWPAAVSLVGPQGPSGSGAVGSGSRIGFDKNTTWICPTGVTSIIIELWGGGGKNGNSIYCMQACSQTQSSGSSANGGAGGRGGYYKDTISVIPGNSYNIIIGDHTTSSTNTYFGTYFAQGGGNGTNAFCVNSFGCAGAGTAGSNGSVIGYIDNTIIVPNYIPASYVTSASPSCCAVAQQKGFAVIQF